MIERLKAAMEGRYRIEGEVGQGGMAVVFLAEDLKHQRRVALKVLKPELAAVVGGERFLAEITTTATLQHPNILPLFDSGQADGLVWYTMPYVEGESLADRLEREAQLPVDEAVRIAVGVARALEHAHRQGVIHRDIKPENILLQDGEPVVADFGIALAVSQAGGGRLTETGLSIGTPYYMSPEQASADRDPDPRSDLYSLACVTYQMLAGQPPFSGSSAQAVLVQILTEDPRPLSRARRTVPPNVEAAVHQALEKLPADRFASVAEFSAALRDPGFRRRSAVVAASAGGAVAGGVPRTRTPLTGGTQAGEETGAGASGLIRGRSWVWPTLAAILALVAGAGWLRGGGAQATAPVARVQLTADDELVSTDNFPTLAVRSDGGAVAYMAYSGRSALMIRELDGFSPRTVYEGAVAGLAFSPDGSALAFQEGNGLHTVPASGGAARRIADDVNQGLLTWLDDGFIYYNGTDGSLVRVRPDGGAGEVVRAAGPERDVVSGPSMLPGGRHALVTVFPGRAVEPFSVGILDLESGEVTKLAQGAQARLVGDDIVLWSDGERLLARRLGGDPPTFVGREIVVQDRVTQPGLGVGDNGLVAFQTDFGSTGVPLTRIFRDGASEVLEQFTVAYPLGLRVSPDGGRVTFDEGFVSGLSRMMDSYVLDLDSGARTRLSFERGATYPTWTPDGERVAYFRVEDGAYTLYTSRADGTGEEEVLLRTGDPVIEVVFVPGMDRIVVRGGDRGAGDASDIWLYDVATGEKVRDLATEVGNQVAPAVSPDGRYLAYVSDERGEQQVYVRSLADPDARWDISDGPGTEPVWAPAGGELYFRNDGGVYAVPLRLEGGFRLLGPPRRLFSAPVMAVNGNRAAWDVMPDGSSFLFFGRPGSNVYLILNGADEIRRRLAEAGG